MSIGVRQATVSDATWLADVGRGSFAPRLRDYLTTTQHGVDAFWEVVLAHPASFSDRCVLIAEDESGKRLGFADLTLVAPNRAHLSYVCVIESARGRGVARALLTAYLGQHLAVETMQLDVFSDNASARALYDRLGFEDESSSTWWVADLALEKTAPAADARLEGLHNARAWMHTFGFAELSVVLGERSVRFGRPSARVLRCFDPSSLEQPAIIAAVVAQLPEVDRVLVMKQGDDMPPSQVGVLSAVNTSLRMSTSAIRTRLEAP